MNARCVMLLYSQVYDDAPNANVTQQENRAALHHPHPLRTEDHFRGSTLYGVRFSMLHNTYKDKGHLE